MWNTNQLTPTRRELLSWFQKNAQPLAEAFEGAARMLDDSTFPGRLHFISHAVRDIADRLVFVLDPQQSSSRVQYENELDWISPRWPNIQVIDATNNGEISIETVSIDYKVAVRIDGLVNSHRDRRNRPSHYELLFRYLTRNEFSQVNVNRRLVSDFREVRDWFMGLTHLRHKKPPEVDEEVLQSQFRRFERMLHSFVGDFFTGTAEIDEILQKANG